MKLDQAFYNTAISDLKAARALHEQKYYPQAIYNLQQTVEKVSKAFGLTTNTITPNDIKRKISHNSEKVFKKQLNSFKEDAEKITRLKKKQKQDFPSIRFVGIPKDIIDPDKMFEEEVKNLRIMQHINSKQFQFASLQAIETMIKNLQPLEEFNFPVDDPSFLEMLSAFQIQIGDQIVSNEVDYKALFLNHKEEITKVFNYHLKICSIVGTLWSLSLLLSSHHDSLRYPCICCKRTPQENYPSTHPLVITFSDLADLLSNALSSYNELENFSL